MSTVIVTAEETADPRFIFENTAGGSVEGLVDSSKSLVGYRYLAPGSGFSVGHYWLFTLNIPKDATINLAEVVWYTTSGADSGIGDIMIGIDRYNNAPLDDIAAYDQFKLSYRTLYPSPPFTQGLDGVANLAPAIQAQVNKVSWSLNDKIIMYLVPSGETETENVFWSFHSPRTTADTALWPMLFVSFTQNPSGEYENLMLVEDSFEGIQGVNKLDQSIIVTQSQFSHITTFNRTIETNIGSSPGLQPSLSTNRIEHNLRLTSNFAKATIQTFEDTLTTSEFFYTNGTEALEINDEWSAAYVKSGRVSTYLTLTDEFTTRSKPANYQHTLAVTSEVDVEQSDFNYGMPQIGFDHLFTVNVNRAPNIDLSTTVEDFWSVNVFDQNGSLVANNRGYAPPRNEPIPRADEVNTITNSKITIGSSFTLQYDATTLTLRAPEFGNREDLLRQQIRRRSWGGKVISYSASYWQTDEIFRLEFTNLTEQQRQDIIFFVDLSLGEPIKITDHEARVYYAYISNPLTEMRQPWDTCGNTWTLELLLIDPPKAIQRVINVGYDLPTDQTQFVITNEMLNYQSSEGNIQYVITTPPENGRLVLTAFPAVEVTDGFFQSDINAGGITYIQDTPTADVIEFNITDGTNTEGGKFEVRSRTVIQQLIDLTVLPSQEIEVSLRYNRDVTSETPISQELETISGFLDQKQFDVPTSADLEYYVVNQRPDESIDVQVDTEIEMNRNALRTLDQTMLVIQVIEVQVVEPNMTGEFSDDFSDDFDTGTGSTTGAFSDGFSDGFS